MFWFTLISHVKKIVSSKVKTLSRIRRYITTRCALSIYKQTLDCLTLNDMHREANLVSLEQRRHIQLLSLMYIYLYKAFGNVERVLQGILGRRRIWIIIRVVSIEIAPILKGLYHGIVYQTMLY